MGWVVRPGVVVYLGVPSMTDNERCRQEGYVGYRANLELSACPYFKRTWEYKAWVHGFKQAERLRMTHGL